MQVESMLEQIKANPKDVSFEEVMSVISEHYDYQPVLFTNGITGDQVVNKAGENEGSCKIFAFAKLHELSESETLACFGKYYRNDVLQNEEGDDHANIRTFIRHGWKGIAFEQPALVAKG